MRGILVTLFSVTALVSAATINKNGCHKDPSQAPAICKASGSESVLVAHEICNKFYKCSHGKPVALNCPPNLLYNPDLEYCDWPNDVDCGDRLIPVEEDDNESNSSQEDQNTESDKDDENENQHSHEDEGHPDPSLAPTICAKYNSDSVLIAHELCNHFYICLHGRPFPVTCSPGLHFDPKSRRCDWPQNVKCGSRVIPKEKNYVEKGHVEEDREIYSDPSMASEICANHETVLVAHENCNYFYQCAGGKPVVRKCPPSLVYNYNTEKCDWLDNVKCGNRIILDGEEHVTEPEDVTEKNVAGHDDPSKAPIICKEEESDDILVAHEICNKFYICAAGTPVARPCPKGLLYNPSKEQCDWPENVTCGNRFPPVDDNEDCDQDKNDEDNSDHEGNNDPSKAPKICAEEDSDGVLIAHEYCDKFYICVNNHPVSMNCPKDLLFNPKRNKCDWAKNVTCWDRVHPRKNNIVPASVQIKSQIHYVSSAYDHSSKARRVCSEEVFDGTLISHEYCTKFYQCVGRHPVEMSCPSVLQFNLKAQHCDWPENVDCGDRTIPEKGEDEADKDESDENDQEPVGNNYDDPSQAPVICRKENSNGVHIAHELCNKFYTCVFNRPFAVDCPDNLWYNPKIDRCDWQKNVQCNGRLKP